MTQVPTITLNNGVAMPQLGFGVFQVPDDGAQVAVEAALECGYRSIDTAMIYGNETGVGRALAASGVARDDLFITTKLWISDFGPGKAEAALDASLERLDLDYVDLYLIHWPAPATDDYLDTWAQFSELDTAKTRSVGVSNFLPEHLDRVVALGGKVPAVNQIELHPAFQNRASVEADRRYGIATEAWSPLAQGRALTAPAVVEAAERHGVSPAQVVLRWHVQNGTIVIPKSVTPSRIASNFDLFGFELSAAEMDAVTALEADGRIGMNPATFNGKRS
ncbi:aldo/keto reductase [Gordonia sp. (in: high G+C Gram-positive bacteria)]|uniref:aldo/keto reductase n=1 Tax=Gordonia sp. (in: high G+C Gram-positive bacteria) TaxID=84139 RepID=UPI0016920006|nr:aldo/keto reductase [Gordonia sp. (in: high G+C Gram-positive bacteria)]NLG45360.1 aldo/keto reductase [Gordonia sp. (in: high G+C Gram-positive bacteria)]